MKEKTVIEDNTIKTDKDRRQAYQACPVLLSSLGGSDNKRTNLEKHYAKDKMSLSGTWMIKNKYLRQLRINTERRVPLSLRDKGVHLQN